MSFLERVRNVLLSTWHLIGEYLYLLPRQDALMRKHFTYPGAEDLPPLRSMLANVSLTLINSHFSITTPRPLSANMIEVGGFHLKPAKMLSEDLQKFMDKATYGVIYISFGSIVNSNTLDAKKIQEIASALGRLKQRVVVKWEDPAPFRLATNVRVLPYASQQDILAHPNCILFVTHGGYNSLIEVTSAGVPVLCVPVFSDQFHNVGFYEEKGIGKRLDLERLTSDTLFDSVTSIINNHSFREKARKLAKIIQDRPELPLDKAIFWIEYVIRHKGAHHLKPASVFLSYYEYLLIDVIVVLSLLPILTFITCKLAWKSSFAVNRHFLHGYHAKIHKKEL